MPVTSEFLDSILDLDDAKDVDIEPEMTAAVP